MRENGKIDISETGDRVDHEDSHVKSDKYEEIKKILQIAQETLPSAMNNEYVVLLYVPSWGHSRHSLSPPPHFCKM